MKHFSRILAALLLFASTTAAAQTLRLNPTIGDTLTYQMLDSMSMVQTVGGAETTTTTTLDGQLLIVAEEVAGDSIRWSLAMPQEHISIDMPTVHQDTTVGSGFIRMVTDRQGELRSVDRAPLELIGSSVMIGQLVKRELSSLFVPAASAQAMKQGEWTTDRSDTAGPMNIVMHAILRYHFDGSADTLGYDAARFRVSSDTLTVSGQGTQGAMTMGIEGNGSMDGTMYYDRSTGMLVAAEKSSTSESNVIITGPKSMVIPMRQSTYSQIRRQ